MCGSMSPFLFYHMTEHYLYKIQYVGFPKTRLKVESVYMIDDVYVGGSIHTRGRILAHFNSAISGRHSNKQLQEYLRLKYQNNEPIIVKMLSNNAFDEAYWIEAIKPKFNKSAITYTNQLSNYLGL